jgi:hypothetical protein
VPSLAAEGSAGTAEVAASTQVAVAASEVVVAVAASELAVAAAVSARSVVVERSVAVAPSARGAADFPVSDMLAFPAAELQEAGRWLAPQELSHRADFPIGILPDQLAPEISLDQLEAGLFKTGN